MHALIVCSTFKVIVRSSSEVELTHHVHVVIIVHLLVLSLEIIAKYVLVHKV